MDEEVLLKSPEALEDEDELVELGPRARLADSLLAEDMCDEEPVTEDISAAASAASCGGLLEGGGLFTGFRMQRLTCRLRLEATPKRRPQVSHTNADQTHD